MVALQIVVDNSVNDNRKPNTGHVARLAKAFEKTLDELYAALGMAESVIANERDELEELREKLQRLLPMRIPVYGCYHAGKEGGGEPLYYIYRGRKSHKLEHVEAYEVSGFCLEPRIDQGDIIVIDKNVTAQPGDTVVCLRKGQVIMGRLKTRQDKLWIMNNEEEIKLQECEEHAVVVEVIKRLKRMEGEDY